ncbi:SDR family NAD(P)-dependent oxidoreductase [Yoonia sp. R2331]|uniref:SDR family NAD(P)-dependent oxidoreductase n=1 Tax=Yoonia sp. R2331 TaxID=3237238 RepID=UPI0034E4A9F2
MRVVITGANRGIGRGLYDLYADRGDVLGTHRAAPSPGFAQLDVTDTASQSAFAASLNGAPVDLLVCNAGVYLDKGASLDDDYPASQWADTFAANVTGVFLTIQGLLPNLRAAKGKIAIISSQMASDTRAPGGSYIYRASKAAVLNLGRNLASDLRTDGIAVGIYHPGWVRTDMGSNAAEISVEEAASGLMARFDALSLDTTGCFQTWDGRDHPY